MTRVAQHTPVFTDRYAQRMANQDEDYVLRWPRDLFNTEVANLVARRRTMDSWADRCAFLLLDAFASVAPRDEFLAANSVAVSDPWTQTPVPLYSAPDPGLDFMRALLDRTDSLGETGARRPFYSQRHGTGAAGSLTLRTTVQEFSRIVGDLESRGYFEQRFEKDCPDAPSTVSPADVIASELGVEGLWPLPLQTLETNQELFFEVIEVLHDLTSAPQSSYIHSYSGCGLHYGNFSTAIGRRVYRSSVNRMMDRTDFGLRLADDGDDRGRLVAVTDSARTELVTAMAQRADPTSGDDVRHAIALFRARGASVQDKRSACIALAGVLESRRLLLQGGMLSKDEGLLFHLANSFGIRHQNGQQSGNYDPIFLDFVFWFYLGAVELSDRLITRQTNNPPSTPLTGAAALPPV